MNSSTDSSLSHNEMDFNHHQHHQGGILSPFDSSYSSTQLIFSRVLLIKWDTEATYCYQVEENSVCVTRRRDNNMINGTKLLNVAQMTRGKRDAILKNEVNRQVVKSGSMILKGVWIPFERAKVLAKEYKVYELLYPLFEDDIQNIYADSLQTRRASYAFGTHPHHPSSTLNLQHSSYNLPPSNSSQLKLNRSLSHDYQLNNNQFIPYHHGLNPPPHQSSSTPASNQGSLHHNTINHSTLHHPQLGFYPVMVNSNKRKFSHPDHMFPYYGGTPLPFSLPEEVNDYSQLVPSYPMNFNVDPSLAFPPTSIYHDFSSLLPPHHPTTTTHHLDHSHRSVPPTSHPMSLTPPTIPSNSHQNTTTMTIPHASIRHP